MNNFSKNINPFLVMEILEKAYKLEKKGENIIHLEVGEPDFNPSKILKRGITLALKNGYIKYTPATGIYELKQEIVKYYKNYYGVSISEEQIIITNGTSPGLFLIFASILDSGDEVILSRPYYACYPNFIRFFLSKPKFFNIFEDENYYYSFKRIKKLINKDTKAILINSPSNPTGVIQPDDVLKDIADSGKYIISDEIYHGLNYGRKKENTILKYTKKAFVINGFSKRYAMTGLRLGFIIVPEAFIKKIEILQQNFFICANSIMQYAGVYMLKQGESFLNKMKNEFNKRRKFLIQNLKEPINIKYMPDGAYYVLINIKHIEKNSLKFSENLLKQKGIAITPGDDFGAKGFIRIAYTSDLDKIKKGLNKIYSYLEENY